MPDTTEHETARDAALARTLTTMAGASPVRRRPQWRGIVALLGVFALAGAGTGALTAGALARTVWTPDDALLKSQMANFAAGGIGYSKPAGVPAFQHGAGAIDLHLGDGPASSVAAVEVWCLGAGSVTWKLGEGPDAPTGSLRCAGVRQTPETRNLEVGPWPHAHLTGTLTGDVAIWAGQLTVAAPASPSGGQQNAVADKVVTRVEYLQAWARMAGCMDDDGYDYSPNESDRILDAHRSRRRARAEVRPRVLPARVPGRRHPVAVADGHRGGGVPGGPRHRGDERRSRHPAPAGPPHAGVLPALVAERGNRIAPSVVVPLEGPAIGARDLRRPP